MDVSQILASLKQERKQAAGEYLAALKRFEALNRAVKVLRRAPMNHAKDSTVAANRRRGRKAWRTRLKNQKHKLHVMKSRKAA